MDIYIRKILRVSVAQICQTIGYNSIQSIPLELLIDSLHKFLQEFAIDLHRNVELFNRSEANLNDVGLSLQSLNISVYDLLEYINHVQPVSCFIEIPSLPAQKSSNLNFLKPGSKEVLTRPVHIYEHLPPILRNSREIEEKPYAATGPSSPISSGVYETQDIKSPNGNGENGNKSGAQNEAHDIGYLGSTPFEGSSSSHKCTEIKLRSDSTSNNTPNSSTREISSVMMTSGGFISPAIEGRMPECMIPNIVESYFGLDAPPFIAPPPALSLAPTSNAKATALSSLASDFSTFTDLGRTATRNEDSAFSTNAARMTGTLKKKLLRKVKKKSNSLLLQPNNSGTAPPALNERVQRKRIRMLQKSLAKNNHYNGAYKGKNGNVVIQVSQDKFLKKQSKLKKKQIRHQNIQKQKEASNVVPNISNNDEEKWDTQDEASKRIKPKKESVYPSIISSKEIAPWQANSFITSLPASKVSNNPLSDVKTKTNPPLVQTPHSTIIGLRSPKYDEVKLSTEPDRNKLNIFKKISSSGRKDRTESAATALATTKQISSLGSSQHSSYKEPTSTTLPSNTTIFSDDQVISLPSGTTITPAPPSGSGRHVYAPPPANQTNDFDSVISVEDNNCLLEGSTVLMQRGDLMIRKPKKRGRKPGSKNQPKLIGTITKKTKKLKNNLFGHHSASNLMEPLNLSHSSIANIANIPLGIASTFPIDTDAASKIKKDRKKSIMGKEHHFIHNSSKSSSVRNLAPTKEEFASINQKLMMMDTVLQPAPPIPNRIHSPSANKTDRSYSPLGSGNSFQKDPDPGIKIRKEKKKPKQSKELKHIIHQGSQLLTNNVQSGKTSSMSTAVKSPPLYTAPNFPKGANICGLPMFPFYPFHARPGLIPSHNIFSNNALFIPSLMGFRPLNPPIRPFLKDEKELSPPLLQAGEGNYSKVAPLVPDTMKLELPPNVRTPTSSATAPVSRLNNSSTPSLSSAKALHNSSPGLESSSGQPVKARNKFDESILPAIVSSSSGVDMNKNFDVTIEVSSDDSAHNDSENKYPSLTNSISPHTTEVSSTSGLIHQSHPSCESIPKDFLQSTGDIDTSAPRRVKEHKKFKKLGKQSKRFSVSSGSSEPRNLKTTESDMNLSVCASISSLGEEFSDSCKKSDQSLNLSKNQQATESGMSPDRRRDHKKIKKLIKESKLKKKKDKKDKLKNKERIEKLGKSDKSAKRKEEKKDKLKKLKKEKKKEKQRNDAEEKAVKYDSCEEELETSTEIPTVVPKLTLKFGHSGISPTPLDSSESRKLNLKPTLNPSADTEESKSGKPIAYASTARESSPELARISPLVTRPPKQKSGAEEATTSNNTPNASSILAANTSGNKQAHQSVTLPVSLKVGVESVIDVDSNSGGLTGSMLPASATILGIGANTANNNPSSSNAVVASGATNCASTAAVPIGLNKNIQHHLLNQQSSSHRHSVPIVSEANRPSSYIDAEGNRVWICPACGKVDDGSAMIGCDGCDAWYHWVCVGIFVAPNDNEDWYCRVCIAKKRGVHGAERKRKRNKRKGNANI